MHHSKSETCIVVCLQTHRPLTPSEEERSNQKNSTSFIWDSVNAQSDPVQSDLNNTLVNLRSTHHSVAAIDAARHRAKGVDCGRRT